MDSMGLIDTYIRYLEDRTNTNILHDLVAALKRSGAIMEAALMQHYIESGSGWAKVPSEGGNWNGQRVYISPTLPTDLQAGDLWFDPLELVSMLLLPAEGPEPGERYAPEALARMQPFVGWMAIRPVTNWQYCAFLRLAKLKPRQVQLAPPIHFLDIDRILHGEPTDPVSSLACPEAELFASWFGKGVCGQSEWQAAARFLSTSSWEMLWGSFRREWAGSFAEGVYAVATPENVNQDWDTLEADEPNQKEQGRMFFDEWQTLAGVGFRTRVLAQFGLVDSPWNDPGVMLDAQLMEVLRRS